jgi:hypothetical protein
MVGSEKHICQIVQKQLKELVDMSVVSMLLVVYVALSLWCSLLVYAACVMAKQASARDHARRVSRSSSRYRMIQMGINAT